MDYSVLEIHQVKGQRTFSHLKIDKKFTFKLCDHN